MASLAGPEAKWWYQQWVFIVPLSIDNNLAFGTFATDPLDADRLAGKRKRKDPLLVDALLTKHAKRAPGV
eukprot:9568512-Lingulodinium_polyedra.AAC.1